jgi:hypothetical protein
MRLRWTAVVAAMIVLSGCGHQVTGLNGQGNNIVPTGQTLFRFETAQVPDFGNFQYLIVINAKGDGQIPIANGLNSNYAEWSFAFLVNGGPGFANTPQVLQYYQDPSQQSLVNHRLIQVPTGTLTFTQLTGNGNVFGFDIRFNRCILDFPSPINTTGQPTPAPSPHPVGQSCPPFFYIASATWTINIFSVDANLVAVDSLGNGAFDTSYAGFTIDTTAQIVDQVYRKPAGYAQPQFPSSQITGFEVWSQP